MDYKPIFSMIHRLQAYFGGKTVYVGQHSDPSLIQFIVEGSSIPVTYPVLELVNENTDEVFSILSRKLVEARRETEMKEITFDVFRRFDVSYPETVLADLETMITARFSFIQCEIYREGADDDRPCINLVWVGPESIYPNDLVLSVFLDTDHKAWYTETILDSYGRTPTTIIARIPIESMDQLEQLVMAELDRYHRE